jgi:molybdopterin-guanine dinucleotide biosynthesis protein A
VISKEKDNNAVSTLNGLVLAGGKSTRMGRDKGAINWHGKEQRYFMADLLGQFCQDVYISCRPEQVDEISHLYRTLPDSYPGMGPYGGILTAFQFRPYPAWLVVACDLPLINKNTLQYLIQHRDPSYIATTFRSPHDQLPEPLITIWEPKSLPVLLEFMNKGVKCPRKVLINSHIKLLDPPVPQEVMNVNKPEELEEAKKLLNQNL